MNFGEVRRAQLDKSTLLTCTLSPWGLLSSVQMLKREWGAENSKKLPQLFIPNKTATMFPDFAVEDLSWTELQTRFCVCSERPTFGQNTVTIIYIIIRVFCPRTSPSLRAQNLSCSSAEGRTSTTNSGTKAAVLPGIE